MNKTGQQLVGLTLFKKEKIIIYYVFVM